MKVYEMLRAYRLANGITQSYIAKTIQVPIKTYNGIERGRSRLSADLFVEICKKGLKVNPGIFFDNTFLESKTSE